MLIYLLVFLITTLFATMCSKNKNKKITHIYLFLIIFILSFLGGVRDLNIGTDVNVYGYNWFNIACSTNNLSDYINIINGDVGYLLINYLVSRFTDNINVFLFVIQFICNGLVITTLYRYKDKCPFWLSLLIYLCLFYCRTFNLLRQSLALSILFYSMKYLERKQNLKFIVATIIASQFHFTALIGFVILVLQLMCNFKTDSKFKFILKLLVIVSAIFVIIFIKDTISVLYSIGVVNFRIYNYLFQYIQNEVDIVYVEIFIKLFFIFIVLMKNKKIKKDLNTNELLVFCLLLDFIFYQIRSVIMYADRLSFYFGYFSMLIIPQGVKCFSSNKRDKLIIYILTTIILLGYWYYKFIYSGSCEIYPYSSGILGL